MENHGSGCRYVGGNLSQLQAVHETHRRFSSALQLEGNDAAGLSVSHVLLRQFVVLVARQSRIAYMRNLLMGIQIFRNFLGILAVTLHPKRQRLQTHVQQEAVVRRRNGSQVSHQLGSGFGDVRLLSELLCVHDAVIGFIRLRQAVILVTVLLPIEVSAVHDGAAHLYRMAVHVFGSGVGHDIRTPFNRSAVHRCRECIVHNQRNAVVVCHLGEFLNVQNDQCRVGNGLRQNRLGVRTECRRKLFFRCIGIHKGAVDAQLLKGNAQQVEGSAIDGGRRHDVVARLADVKNSIEVGRLSRGRQKSRHAAFQVGNFCGHRIVGRVLKPRVKIAFCLQVEQVAHLCRGVVFKRRALINRQSARLSLRWSVSGVDALRR